MIKDFSHIDLLGFKVFEKAIVKPPFRMIAKMPDEACFYFVTSGAARVNTPTAELELRREEGLVMRCGSYLNDFLAEEGVEYCEAIAVHLYPDLLKQVYSDELPDFLAYISDIEPLTHEKYGATALMSNYITGLKFYFENPALVSEELMKLKIKELMILLAKTDNLQMIRELFASLFVQHEYDFKEIIEANIFKDIGIEELASLCTMSLSSFKRRFRNLYGNSPGRYIRGKRLEKASKLLSKTELSITEICYESGFSDLAHFSRLFNKEMGLSPSKYRLTLLN